MLPGDSDHFAWKDRIMPEFGKELQSEILVASHHGSRSFFMDVIPDQEYSRDDFWTDHLKTINPNLVLISVDDGSKYGHPDPEALKEYEAQAPAMSSPRTRVGTWWACSTATATIPFVRDASRGTKKATDASRLPEDFSIRRALTLDNSSLGVRCRGSTRFFSLQYLTELGHRRSQNAV